MILRLFMFENVLHRTLGKSGQESRVNKIKKLDHERLRILHFRTKLVLQLMHLESRKEKKGAPRKEHFILLLYVILFVLLRS